MQRAYYSSSIVDFISTSSNEIIGELTPAHARTLEQTQLNAWLEQINILKRVLISRSGRIYFEFTVSESRFTSYALHQVTDYCFDGTMERSFMSQAMTASSLQYIRRPE